MRIKNIKRLRLIITAMLFFILLCAALGTVSAGENKGEIPDRYGMGLVAGKSYDPVHNIDFFLLSGCILFDYEKVWRHKAPEQLRFKVEYEVGEARKKWDRFMSSLNMFALYYLSSSDDGYIRPYAEAGIGVIYTDFQVKGQGLRINFNPQIGIGSEFRTRSMGTYFLSLRLHHISNGNLYKENRGVNSVLVSMGRYF